MCVVEEYADDLPSYAARVSKYSRQLERLGAPVPATFRQAVGSAFPEGGAFSITGDRSDAPLVFQMVQSIYPCSQTEWGNRELDASDAVVAYLVQGEGAALDPTVPPASREATTRALNDIAC